MNLFTFSQLNLFRITFRKRKRKERVCLKIVRKNKVKSEKNNRNQINIIKFLFTRKLICNKQDIIRLLTPARNAVSLR